ncbi:MAG: AhpC/TSA family protein [candidate division NC10 bacterium]
MQLGPTQDKLKAMGVETVAVVNTPLERARLYFKYHPARMVLAADPEAATHRAFGVPAGVIVEDESAASWPQSATMGQLLAVGINPTGELPAPQHPFAANETLNKKDAFELTETDREIAATHGTQLVGHFLIDREGIIRWRHIEAGERIGDLAKLPSGEEILRAARSL